MNSVAQKVDSHIDRWVAFGGFFIAGWISCSAYYGTLNLQTKEQRLEHVQAVEIPKLKAAVRCEDRRADKATDVAVQAIIAAGASSVKAPSGAEIPSDNCPKAAGK